MLLWRLFFTNPVVAIALCVCMAAILWTIALLRKQKRGPDRFLTALIGVICITEGMRLLQQAGFIALPGRLTLDSFAELTIAALYLISILILRVASLEHKSTAVRLRLVEADDQPRVAAIVTADQTDQMVKDIVLDSNPLATIALDRSGRVIYWNAAAERLLGWRARDVIGRPSPSSLNSPVVTRNGMSIRVDTWVSATHDASGHLCGTVYMLAPAASQAVPTLTCEALAC